MDVDAYLESLKPSVMTLGLERIRIFLDRLGISPKGPHVLVAGTNGKGSTAALLASILEMAVGPTGLYTSPHLLSIHERIRISGVPVERETLRSLVHTMAPVAEEMKDSPTFFEFLTAAALLHFQHRHTAVNVLEVGLGGRLDATNACKGTHAVITRVALDHTHILGKTLREIAVEKAGIMRRGQTVIIGPQRPKVLSLLKDLARERGARPVPVQELARTEILSMDLKGMQVRVDYGGKSTLLYTHLTGAHQVENLATALVAADHMAAPTTETLQRAAATTRWPGRLEFFATGGRDYLIDSAHNPSGIHSVRRFLDRVDPPRPLRLLFGSVSDKDPRRALRTLLPAVDSAQLVPIPTIRSWDRETRERLAREFSGLTRVSTSSTSTHALENDPVDGGTTLVTGSIYLVGEVMQWLNRSPWQLTTQATN